MVVKLKHSPDVAAGICEIGFHVLDDPGARPRVLVPARDASMTGGRSVGGESRSRVSTDTLQFKWVRFEMLALHPGQHTDFRMFITEGIEDPNDKLRFEIRP
jgi:hypothetical protein